MAQQVKNPWETGLIPGSRKILWRKKMTTYCSILA